MTDNDLRDTTLPDGTAPSKRGWVTVTSQLPEKAFDALNDRRVKAQKSRSQYIADILLAHLDDAA